MDSETMSRRTALRLAAAGGLGALAGGCASTPVATAASGRIIPIRFDDPAWNRDAKVRLEGDLDPKKQIFGGATGVVHGVKPGERVRPLFRFDVFSSTRTVRQPDGSYLRMSREVVFYRDLVTNKILETWDNPYTGERVRVVDVANDPFNYVLSEYFPDPPSYGGLNKEKPPKRPFLLKWTHWSADTISLESDIHLYYKSALQPDKWPRESPGPMTQASEMFRYFIRRQDLENPDLGNVPYNGVWSRLTPWLPWMLMGPNPPGHAYYTGMMASRKTLDAFPQQDVIARVKERYPKYLVAPEKWEEPSWSSYEHYAAEQTPAPLRP